MPKTKLIRVFPATAKRCAALADVLPKGVNTADIVDEAVAFYMLAFSSLYEAKKLADQEGRFRLDAKGLLEAFVTHLAQGLREAADSEAAEPDPIAVRMAATIPGATPEDVQGFAVEVFDRILEITQAAGMAPEGLTPSTADDVLGRFVRAAVMLASRQAATEPIQTREVQA